MGIFDAILFETPFLCKHCGSPIDQVQTKVFEPGLNEYRTGDVIGSSPIMSGIIRETLYCPSCNKNAQTVYLAMWHSVFVGSFSSHNEAERRINEVDRVDLIEFVAEQQRRALQWHDRFSRLYGELQILHDYEQQKITGVVPDKIDTARFFKIRQYVDSDDSLGSLIAGNKPVNPEDETEVPNE